MLNWPNIIIVVNVFKEILAVTRVRHIVISKRVIVQKNVLISNIQMQIICDIPILFGK